MKTDEIPEFPPFMPTWLAARYCGFRSPQGLYAAFRRGKVRPWGRRGGSGTWKRDDLDEFLRGEAELGGPMEVRDEREGARPLQGRGLRAAPSAGGLRAIGRHGKE